MTQAVLTTFWDCLEDVGDPLSACANQAKRLELWTYEPSRKILEKVILSLVRQYPRHGTQLEDHTQVSYPTRDTYMICAVKPWFVFIGLMKIIMYSRRKSWYGY